ncbi:hypothetical protein [Methylopila sp. 73B]|uniref:hypothetical protein n=1 Tax=Methylopila sp. 73B TaxID=1120792 RepID=UPI00037A47B4|nr:hypothetical protein [Methylopila sp. 73B]
METRVNLYPYQVIPAGELNALQGYAQASMDRIVRELLFDEPRYSGFTVTAPSALQLSVARGAFYRAGQVYPSTDVQSLSLTSLLPSSGSRIVLVVVSGDTVNTDEQSVKFLVDAVTRAVQPRPVARRVARQASIELVAGAASASPSRPALPAGSIVVSSLRLAPSGVVDGPDMETANSAISLEKAMTAIALLQAQDKKTAALINTLRSDNAAMASQIKATATRAELGWMIRDIIQMKERLDIPDNQSPRGIDYFVTDSETDGASTAIVEGGYVKFGEIERASQLVALLNPSDSRVDISEIGLIMPKSTDALRIEVDDKDAEIAIASYGIAANVLKKQTLTRSYYYYAEKQPYEELETKLKQQYVVRVRNPKTDAFEVLELAGANWRLVSRGNDGLPGDSPFWRIDVTTDTWSIGATTVNVSGAKIAQTFLCAQAGWHKRLDVGFTDIAAVGNVFVAITKCNEAGTPDLNNTVATATVAASALKKWPAWSSVLFDPFWLERGVRYAVVLISTGNHRVGISKSNDLTNGTLFISTDGDYWSGSIEQDLVFRLWGCKFASNNVTVEIGDIALPGGIRQLQAIFTGFQPAGTDLIMQAQIAGAWRTIGEKDATILSTAPTQVKLRLVFVGTKDLMPGVDLTASRMIASRPRTPTTHISTVQSMPAGGVTASSVKLVLEMIGFDAAIHTLTAAVLHGAGYATEVAATSFRTETIGPGKTRRVFTIGGLPNITSFKLKFTMGSSNPAKLFSVVSRDHTGYT